jgi:hypothetical protein
MNGWLSRREVLAASGFSVRKLQRLTHAGKVKTRPARGRSDGPQGLEYSFDSLPFAVRVKIQQQQSAAKGSKQPGPAEDECSTQLATCGDRSPAPFALLCLPKSPAPTGLAAPAKVALSPEEEVQAATRLAVIHPLIEFQRDEHSAACTQLHLALGLLLPSGRKVLTTSDMVEYLAHQNELSPRTIWRMWKGYRKAGKFGLVRDVRSDKNQSHFFSHHPKAAAVAAALYLDQRKMSVKGIHRLLVDQRKVLHIAEIDIPSYGAVRA